MSNRTHGHVLIELLNRLDRSNLKVAEIGIWKSHTIKRVLRGCGGIIDSYWAIDPFVLDNHWNYRLLTVEKWNELYFHACKMMYWFPQLHVLRMTSKEASLLFPEKYFDLVFIDANHEYKFVKEDSIIWEKLIKNSGLLTGHDYGGKKAEVKKAVDELFGNKIEVLDAGVWVKRGDEYNGLD